MDSITDPLNRATHFGWCNCGSLISITDPKNQVTTFNRDLESRVYQKVFADNSSINYFYFTDDNIQQISYTDVNGQPLNPATPSVSFTYDPNYNRVKTMVD